MKIVEIANSTDMDEAAHNESHLDLLCLNSQYDKAGTKYLMKFC